MKNQFIRLSFLIILSLRPKVMTFDIGILKLEFDASNKFFSLWIISDNFLFSSFQKHSRIYLPSYFTGCNFGCLLLRNLLATGQTVS